MKVYVDKLPKSCDDCEFGYFYDCQYCTLRPDLMRKDEWCEKEKHCPLETTQSLKQQVRNEVCEEIREEVKKLIDKDFGLCNHEYANGYCYGLQYDLAKILDRIQREPKKVFSKFLSKKYQGDKCEKQK